MGQTLIKVAEVAEMLHANPKTVARWSTHGYFDADGVHRTLPVAFRTLGGHRLYDLDVIRAIAESLVGNGGDS